MAIWLRIVLIVALAILLWVLVVDLAGNVDGPGGSAEPSVPGSAPPGAP
jgi:hypothetical protein